MYQAFSLFYQVFYWLMLFRILTSFMPVGQDSPPIRFVYTLTEPLLKPIRDAFGLISVGGMYLDISPIVVMLLLSIIRNLLWYI